MPPTEGVSIRIASDAIDIGWGGHTMQGFVEHAHDYFSKEESVESSTYRELISVFMCLHAMIGLCEGKFMVFQVDAKNVTVMPQITCDDVYRGSDLFSIVVTIIR